MELLYPKYYKPYVNNVNANTVSEALKYSYKAVLSTFEAIEADYYTYAYDTDKWTIAQLLQHCLDTERIFAYRALHIARQDTGQLLGFNENSYAKASLLNIRPKDDLIKEYQALRRSTLALFNSFNPLILNKSKRLDSELLSVNAIAFIISGHELHHLRILNERYL